MISPIRIDDALRDASGGNLALGVISASITVTDHDEGLWGEIDQVVSALARRSVEEIAGFPQVQALRATYKALGKDPSRYRGSNEALLRRITQGKGLYRVNTVVDINNLISLESRRSVASYDRAKLGEEIVFRAGRSGESYDAIGKGTLNVDGLPVFADERGPFGSSTSDSTRAMIRLPTSELLMVMIGFDGETGLMDQVGRAAGLLEKYASGHDMSMAVVT